MTAALAATLGALAGLIAGSFLATLAVRWPEGRGLGGRSTCDGCGRVLSVVELVPLLSYLRTRGRCATCGTTIDPRHPLLELAAALIGAVALGVSPGWEGASGALFGWLLLTLGALDLAHLWLPNRLTALLAAAGAVRAATRPDWADLAIGGALGFAVLWTIGALYRRVRRRDGLGAGDPKLFAGIGLWLGWQALPVVLLLASATGLAAALAMHLRGRAVSAGTRLPLGTLLAIAAWPAWIVMQG